MTVQQTIAEAGEPQPLLLSREHYLLLDKAGAFDSYSKTEFIDGIIYTVNAQYSRHSRVNLALVQRLSAAVDASSQELAIGLELTIDLPSGELPQPDLLVARDLPENAAAPAADVLIAIEITSSTLAMDLGRKPNLYASAGIAEYWAADVAGGCFHQFWSPGESGYTQRRVIPFGQPLTAAAIPDLTIATDGLA